MPVFKHEDARFLDDNWNARFIELAGIVAQWSKDPSTQVGAVAIGKHRQILATGYNGFPRGFMDDGRIKDREQKYDLIVHAEANCIYNASLTGTSLHGSTLYVHGLPVCHECAKAVIQVGIKHVYAVTTADRLDRWKVSVNKTVDMFEEVGVHFDYAAIG